MSKLNVSKAELILIIIETMKGYTSVLLQDGLLNEDDSDKLANIQTGMSESIMEEISISLDDQLELLALLKNGKA
jgi:hypothetical protein